MRTVGINVAKRKHVACSLDVNGKRELLVETPNPEEFSDFDLSELSHFLQQASHGRYGQKKAEEIQEAACPSVGGGFLADVLPVQMQCLLQQLDLLEQKQEQRNAEIGTMRTRIPQYNSSVPGVGAATGATILAEIGDIRRFKTLEKVVAYAGIHPAVVASLPRRTPI